MFDKWVIFSVFCTPKYGIHCKDTSFLAFIVIFIRKYFATLRFYTEMFNKSAIQVSQTLWFPVAILLFRILVYKIRKNR